MSTLSYNIDLAVRCHCMTMESYSVRSLFLWKPRSDQKLAHIYEERITLWLAKSMDHAIELAEEEADEYASDGEKYLEFSQGFALFEAITASGIEVFSLLRESDLEPAQYIDAFFDTGNERQGE